MLDEVLDEDLGQDLGEVLDEDVDEDLESFSDSLGWLHPPEIHQGGGLWLRDKTLLKKDAKIILSVNVRQSLVCVLKPSTVDQPSKWQMGKYSPRMISCH